MVATAILWRPRANNTRYIPVVLQNALSFCNHVGSHVVSRFRYSYAEFFEGDEGAETAQDDDNTQVQLETLTVLVRPCSGLITNPWS